MRPPAIIDVIPLIRKCVSYEHWQYISHQSHSHEILRLNWNKKMCGLYIVKMKNETKTLNVCSYYRFCKWDHKYSFVGNWYWMNGIINYYWHNKWILDSNSIKKECQLCHIFGVCVCFSANNHLFLWEIYFTMNHFLYIFRIYSLFL